MGSHLYYIQKRRLPVSIGLSEKQKEIRQARGADEDPRRHKGLGPVGSKQTCLVLELYSCDDGHCKIRSIKDSAIEASVHGSAGITACLGCTIHFL